MYWIAVINLVAITAFAVAYFSMEDKTRNPPTLTACSITFLISAIFMAIGILRGW